MPAELWLLVEQSAPALAMRGSAWLYPLVNVAHILALMVFFAAVAVMDTRLLGGLQQVRVTVILRPCRRIAVGAFLVQAASGVLLFSAEATTVAVNTAFVAKMVVIVLALANVIAVESLWGRVLGALPAGFALPPGVRLCAALSLGSWIAAAALGRLIAYV